MSEKDKWDEIAAALWSVTVTFLKDGEDLGAAMQHRFAAKLREQGAEIAQLKTQLAEAEKRGMERAMSIACAVAHEQRTRIHEAICAAMEKL